MLRNTLFLLVIMLVATSVAPATVVYYEDFESGWDTTGWSNTTTSTTPVGSRTFLGEFGNQTVTLTGDGSAPAGDYRVSFDLFVIRSWDGDGTFGFGPDTFSFFGTGGGGSGTFVSATFAEGLNPGTQSYPTASSSPESGASEVDTLGYINQGNPADSVYHFVFDFTTSGGAGTMNWAASGLQSLADESWGIDNVMVEYFSDEPIPEPGTVFLFGGAGLALLLFRRLRIAS